MAISWEERLQELRSANQAPLADGTAPRLEARRYPYLFGLFRPDEREAVRHALYYSQLPLSLSPEAYPDLPGGCIVYQEHPGDCQRFWEHFLILRGAERYYVLRPGRLEVWTKEELYAWLADEAFATKPQFLTMEDAMRIPVEKWREHWYVVVKGFAVHPDNDLLPHYTPPLPGEE